MTTRYIAVKGCNSCPHSRQGDSAFWCLKAPDALRPRKLGFTIKNLGGYDTPWWDGIVPDWCPLPVLKEDLRP